MVSERGRTAACAAIALVTVFLCVVLENVVVARAFPRLGRVTQDFSPAYLRRSIARLADDPPQTIFFGDSFLWGWGLRDEETAVARLRAAGCACRNFAFGLNSPTNEYALVRLMQHDGIHPRAVVLEVNQVLFNPKTMEYDALRDQVYDVTNGVLGAEDRRRFRAPRRGVRGRVDRLLSSLSAVYALHADAREGVFLGEPEELPRNPSFERLYDLRPLGEKNVAVHYLERTLDLLRQANTPVYAFFTPTNRQAFGTRLDDPRFGRNTAYLDRLLVAHGARILRIESAFAGGDFYDNIHLNAIGQRKLAILLGSGIATPDHGQS